MDTYWREPLYVAASFSVKRSGHHHACFFLTGGPQDGGPALAQQSLDTHRVFSEGPDRFNLLQAFVTLQERNPQPQGTAVFQGKRTVIQSEH